MRELSWLPPSFFLILLIMLPLFFGHPITAALIKLKLEPTNALLAVIEDPDGIHIMIHKRHA